VHLQLRLAMGSTVMNTQRKKAAALAICGMLANTKDFHWPGPNCPICLVKASSYVRASTQPGWLLPEVAITHWPAAG
jgi:hypothetical protein